MSKLIKLDLVSKFTITERLLPSVLLKKKKNINIYFYLRDRIDALEDSSLRVGNTS